MGGWSKKLGSKEYQNEFLKTSDDACTLFQIHENLSYRRVMKTAVVDAENETVQQEQGTNCKVASKLVASARKKITKRQERRIAKAKCIDLIEQVKDASKIAFSLPTDIKRRSKKKRNDLEYQRNKDMSDDNMKTECSNTILSTEFETGAKSATSKEITGKSFKENMMDEDSEAVIENSSSGNHLATSASRAPSEALINESNPNICFSEDYLNYMGHKITISIDEVEVSLTKFGDITMRGMFYLVVLSGKIVINGFKCKKGSKLKIVCPQSGLHLSITGIDSKEKVGVFKLLPLDNEGPYTSLMKGISMYRRFKNLFSYKFNKNMDRSREVANTPSESTEVLPEIPEPNVPFVFNKDDLVQHDQLLKHILESVAENPDQGKICVCGPKNSGKSTTSIFLTNALISGLASKKNVLPKVYWLDCDVGQPEFTLPGCVSLVEISEPIFASHFCHLRKPLKSFYVGAINIADIVEIYLSALEKLVECLNTLDGSVPVVVNMPGWIEVGLGLEITSNIMRIIQPHYVIQYKTEGFKKMVELDCDTINDCDDLRLRQSNKSFCRTTSLKPCSFQLDIIPLEVSYPKPYSLSAIEERHLRVLAYFYQNMYQESSYNSAMKNLLDFPRKKVSFLGKSLEVMPMNRTVNPKLILMAMNMTVVAFCTLEENSKLVEPLPMNHGSFHVSSWDCQKENHRIAMGFGIITG